MKILLVEHNIFSLEQFKKMLGKNAVEGSLISCWDGEEALEITGKEHPDIVIMDIQQPCIDSLVVLKILRNLYDDIYFLFTISPKDYARLEKAISLGINDYLVKPFAESEFITRVKMGLKSKEEKIKATRNTAESVQKSADLFRTIATFSYDWKYWLDPEGNLIFISPSCERITGYGPDEFLNDPGLLEKIVHPDDRAEVITHVHKPLKKDELSPLIFRIIHRSGKERWINHICKPVYDSRGKFLGRISSNQDVTDYKHAEVALLQSETHLSNILKNMIDMIAQIDKEGMIQYLSPSYKNILGYEPEDLLGKSVFEFMHPDDLNRLTTLFFENMEAGVSRRGECRIRHTNGHYLWIESFGNFLYNENNEICGAIIASHDITERKQAAQERDRFFNLSIDMLCIAGLDGFFKELNPAWEKTLGWTNEELTSKPFLEYIHPEDHKATVHVVGTLSEGKVLVNFENRYLCKDGSYRWLSWNAFPLVEENLIFGVARDVTELKQAKEELQKAYWELEKRIKKRTAELIDSNEKLLAAEIAEREKAEEALRKSEEHFRQIVELIPSAIIVHSKEKIVFTNSAAANLLDVANPRMLLNKSIVDFAHPEHRETMRQQIQQLIKNDPALNKIEAKFTKTDGTVVDIELTSSPFSYQGKPAIQTIIHNITERKKVEAELKKADKLESIGILAGGIAHDFNNYLATMLGNISLAKVYKDDPAKVYEKLDNIEKATLQAKELTHQLFIFAKGGDPVKKVVDLEDLIQNNTNFALSGSNACCKFFFPKDISPVEVDEVQIGQVINNMIINAVQAMPGGGTIRVKAENVTVGAGKNAYLAPLPEGHYVKISIEDEGVGIPEEYRQKIFDPFFSTKPGGSGLGLAICYAIVKKHGGYIDVHSQVEAGTTFDIYLPASTTTNVSEDTKQEKIIYGRGKILIMEDEESLREVIGDILSLLGYEVGFAGDGTEALVLYKKARDSGQPFDVVLMDLTIPGGMGGETAIKKLLEIDPGVKAIVSSGYSDNSVLTNYNQYGFKGIVVKPYKIERLSRVLDEVIRG